VFRASALSKRPPRALKRWFVGQQIVRHLVASGDRVIAAADNLAVARAAYDTAVALWPQAAIELRQKGRVRRGSSREAVRVFAQGFTRDAGPDALGYYSPC
jgi:hypothetical protein